METKFRFGKSHWKEFGEKENEIIEKEREERLKKLKELNLGRVCPACTKPNSVSVDFCTGCNFTLTARDIVQLPKNVFLDIIEGRNTGTKILYRDETVCAFDDKFGVSGNHLDIVPIIVIPDITHLRKEHIPLIEKLYNAGLNEFKDRASKKDPRITHIPKEEIENCLVCGFNEPVSVKHLHLHMVLPPFKHEKVFQYPRWHNMKKVLKDLESFGKVKVYQQYPNDKEGENEYQRAMTLNKKYPK